MPLPKFLSIALPILYITYLICFELGYEHAWILRSIFTGTLGTALPYLWKFSGIYKEYQKCIEIILTQYGRYSLD